MAHFDGRRPPEKIGIILSLCTLLRPKSVHNDKLSWIMTCAAGRGWDPRYLTGALDHLGWLGQ
ncbi:hypothetical protein, partial [Frankia sp. CiP1_Cm_nod1]|uniref:hypothetical protein n=1 Tax=Frankia sp. CiP1_Cm_nod1 TaxID=2897160 RepID=UPI0020257EAB